MNFIFRKDYINIIRRYIKISFFVSAIIPLALLVYVSIKYINPSSDNTFPIQLSIILFCAVALSILGLVLLTKTTNSSITSLQDIYVKLNTFIDNTKQLTGSFYPNILLENIIKSAVDLTYSEAGSLLLLDDADTLKLTVAVGHSNQSTEHKTLKKGEGVTGYVAKTGKPMLINDTTKNKHYNPAVDSGNGIYTKSILCVPLIYNNKTMGIIEVFNKMNGEFTEEDKELAYAFADQAAVSIFQSRLIESKQNDIIHMTEILVTTQDFFLGEKNGHVRRVANYANLIGKHMGLSETDLKDLHYACLLHDIGFIKMGSQKIFENIRWIDENKYVNHPQLGYEMIRPISIWSTSSEIILAHHEKYDGTGYPLGKKKEEIPLGSKILSVAEVFDVLTSKNSYKEPIGFTAALNEIEAHSGSQFDPEIVKAFESSMKDSDIILD